MRLKRATIAAVLLTLCMGGLASSASAQEYRFRVPQVRVVLTVQPDASVAIDYRMEFENQPGAHAIDIVDVGMPTKDYEVLGASVNGKQLSVWKPSTEIKVGPEVHLDAYSIPAGGKGVFECSAHVTNMVFEDRKDAERASLQFTPTWFGDRYVVGETDLLLVVKFPPGIDPDSVVWHSDEKPFFQKGILDPDGVAFVSWKEHYRFTGPVMFGCSFPRAVMERVEKAGLGKMFMVWWMNSPKAQRVSGAAILILFATFFLLITRGTGITLLLIGMVTFTIVMVMSPALHLGLWPAVLLLAGTWYWGMHRRKPRYLPALASVESGKICRALTAPEAAILLDVPLQRVLSMVITDLLGKGVIRIAQSDPPQVEPVGKRPVANVVELADGRRVALEPHEVGFLDVLSAPPADVRDKDFAKPIERLVGLVRYKMAGFDPDATREYHRAVTERAWEKVEGLQDPKGKDDLANRLLNRLRMAENYDDRMEAQRAGGWLYMPRWYHYHGYGRDRNWIRDVDHWMKPAANRAAQAVLKPAKGLNFADVDRFTLATLSEIAKSAAKGGSGHGGGCACAGCACACACAGGGR